MRTLVNLGGQLLFLLLLGQTHLGDNKKGACTYGKASTTAMFSLEALRIHLPMQISH
jgi:hypothetical protein